MLFSNKESLNVSLSLSHSLFDILVLGVVVDPVSAVGKRVGPVIERFKTRIGQ
jgi:hypothetical protein